MDGRSQQVSKAMAVHEAIEFWLADRGSLGVNLASHHCWLREEHGFDGSLRCLERYVGKTFPRPRERGLAGASKRR